MGGDQHMELHVHVPVEFLIAAYFCSKLIVQFREASHNGWIHNLKDRHDRSIDVQA